MKNSWRAEQGQCPVIHCRAGVGRTGVAGTLLALLDSVEAGEITRENLIKKLNGTILEGRKQRSPLFVQTQIQYEMLVKLLEKIIGNPACLKT